MHLLEKDGPDQGTEQCFSSQQGRKIIFDVFVPNLNALINGISNQVDFDGEYEPG